MSINFGHCVGCDQPIRPPYLSFEVRQSVDDGNHVWNWEEIDVCGGCASKLTASDLHRLVSADEDEPAAIAMETGTAIDAEGGVVAKP